MINIDIIYELHDWPRNPSKNFVVKNCLPLFKSK